MKKYGMKIVELTMVVILLVSASPLNLYASSPEHTDMADFLKEINMFAGTDKGYELEVAPNRLQAAVMIVRLLGKEEETLAANYGHPFTDVPNWASPYVGYLYEFGITAGIGDGLYGGGRLLTADQYMTFLLRVSNYDDAAGDFVWNQSLKKANELLYFSNSDLEKYGNAERFLRDDLVYFTYKSLMCDVKGENISLLKKLINQEVVDEEAMYKYNIVGMNGGYYDVVPQNREELVDLIAKLFYNFETNVTIDISNFYVDDLNNVINEASQKLVVIPGTNGYLNQWNISYTSKELTLEVEYACDKERYEYALAEGKRIVDEITSEDMSDYEKERVIHDYIINHTAYDGNSADQIPADSYTFYGIYKNGIAVCQGYADAFHYMTNLAGIPSGVVVGSAGAELHGWNHVELDGENYQVDVTWDDPVMADGSHTLSYQYFNISDDKMDNDHQWEKEDYEACNGTKYNYYVYNNLVVTSEEELESRIRQAVQNKETVLNLVTEGFAVDNNGIKAILSDVYGYNNIWYSSNVETGAVELEISY